MRGHSLNKRISITGGAGFIGSDLYEGLPEQVDGATCVYNVYISRRANIVHLISNPLPEALRQE